MIYTHVVASASIGDSDHSSTRSKIGFDFAFQFVPLCCSPTGTTNTPSRVN